MSARVVCLSRVAMTGDDAVGRAVAAALGFRYVDQEIVELASAKASVDPALVEAAEGYRSLLKRLFARLASGPADPDGGEPEVDDPTRTRDLRVFVRAAIAEVAAEGGVVIGAHGASIALGQAIGVLRVLLTASEETRLERLKGHGLLRDEREAARAVRESDRARAAYLADFYGVAEELPTHYDLVVNTDRLSEQAAVAAIVAAVRATPAIP